MVLSFFISLSTSLRYLTDFLLENTQLSKFRKSATPFTSDLPPKLVIEALDGSTADAPAYPDLVKPYQQKVGCLMYACTATRPDLAYAVHQHCRALSRPTPELMAELDVIFAYCGLVCRPVAFSHITRVLGS